MDVTVQMNVEFAKETGILRYTSCMYIVEE